MSQQLQLVIDGMDLTPWVEQDKWTIAQNWSRQGDIATFVLKDEHPIRNQLTFAIGPLATVTLTDVGLGATLFSGVVPRPQLATMGPNLAKWELQCVDWTYLSDRAVVAGDISNLTADALAIRVTQLANCGISAASTADGGFVEPGPPIPRIQFRYDTLTQAWTRISKLASLISTYGWYVDENRQLHFYPASNAPSSGLTLTDDISAQVASPSMLGYDNDSFAYEWDATSIRNSITVRGADYSSQKTDLWVGNGSQQAFPLTFVPDATNIGSATLTVGGVTKTVSAETGSSATTDWVIVGNAANSWFLQPANDPTPAASIVIQFTYPFLQPVLSRTADTTSIARFKNLPNNGVFSYYIADTSLPDLLSAQKRALREVQTYSQPSERVALTTLETFTGHVRAGQLVRVVNGVVPDSQRDNASGIDDNFLVLQNRINGRPGLYRTYQITAQRV